jgi:hypothetical protein
MHCTRLITLLVTVMYGYHSLAQDSLPGLMFNVKANMIMSSKFSNIPAKTEYPDENSIIERTEMPGAKKLGFGFEIGGEMWFLRNEKFKLVLGLSYSRTTAAYHYSYVSEDPTGRFGYTHLKKSNQRKVEVVYNPKKIYEGERFKI